MTVQAGEDSKLNGKKKSGRIAVFVNERWCYPQHATMKGCLCSPETEPLAVGMLPYYLSQEFSSAIPLSAHGVVACDITHLTVVDL